jgi:hypothetical protein
MNDFSSPFYIKDENVLLVVKMKNTHSLTHLKQRVLQHPKQAQSAEMNNMVASRRENHILGKQSVVESRYAEPEEYVEKLIMTELCNMKQ